MPYSSIQMHIGWIGLGILTEVCIPIFIINFKVRGIVKESVPYMMKVILTHISIKCKVVHPHVN